MFSAFQSRPAYEIVDCKAISAEEAAAFKTHQAEDAHKKVGVKKQQCQLAAAQQALLVAVAVAVAVAAQLLLAGAVAAHLLAAACCCNYSSVGPSLQHLEPRASGEALPWLCCSHALFLGPKECI